MEVFTLQIVTLIAGVVLFMAVETEGKYYRRVCYFANWARWRRGIGKHTPADVNPFLCTHIIFAFAKFRSDGRIVPQEPGPDEKDYRALMDMKQQNRNLKLLVSFGGWNFGSRKFSNMAANASTRAIFVHNAVLFLRKYGFDGLDIDWEYPAVRGGRPSDKQNLVILCRELVSVFSNGAALGTRDRLLLTAAVPASPRKSSMGYDIPSLSKYLDFVNLMTYNFHGNWERKTGFNSPLDDSIASARWWHRAGMPKNKITVGMATYGRSFTLSNPRDHGVKASAFIGPAGPVTRQKGVWSYYEICQEIQRGGGRVVLDNDQKVPYYVKGSLWISYDNEWSLQIKAKWVKSNNYGGVMFWALDLDDFSQVCKRISKRKYPLIEAVKDILDGGDPDTKNETCHISTHTPTEEFTCHDREFGMYADESDCGKFYICAVFGKFRLSCPVNSVWNPVARTCSQRSRVNNLCFCRDLQDPLLLSTHY